MLEFIDFLNSAHHSIKFTAEYSKETIHFLDVQVIKKDDRIVTDLYTKPTDTHQLLHHSSCHPSHTKRGIPYGQALRLRRICSEEGFFAKRLGELETYLLERGYSKGEIDSQVNRVKGLDRRDLLDRSQNHNDDSRIPLVLTRERRRRGRGNGQCCALSLCLMQIRIEARSFLSETWNGAGVSLGD